MQPIDDHEANQQYLTECVLALLAPPRHSTFGFPASGFDHHGAACDEQALTESRPTSLQLIASPSGRAVLHTAASVLQRAMNAQPQVPWLSLPSAEAAAWTAAKFYGTSHTVDSAAAALNIVRSAHASQAGGGAEITSCPPQLAADTLTEVEHALLCVVGYDLCAAD